MGRINTNRIKDTRKTGGTKTDGENPTCLFCYGRKSLWGKETRKIAESRNGILFMEGMFARPCEILVPLIKQEQSVRQTCPEQVKYRSRYQETELKIDRGARWERITITHAVYMEKHPDTAVVQMYSVFGSKGEKTGLKTAIYQLKFRFNTKKHMIHNKTAKNAFFCDILTILNLRKSISVRLRKPDQCNVLFTVHICQ